MTSVKTAAVEYDGSYMRCPYEDCSSNQIVYEGNNNRPKTLGLYKIKNCGDNILIFQCQKCSRPFRLKIFGVALLWADMTFNERRSHKIDDWVIQKMGGKK